MFTTENAFVARRISIFTVKLLVSLAIVCKLDIVLFPSGFPVKTIHNFVHSLIKCIKQAHRNLSIGKRDSVKFAFFVHPKTSLILNIFIKTERKTKPSLVVWM